VFDNEFDVPYVRYPSKRIRSAGKVSVAVNERNGTTVASDL